MNITFTIIIGMLILSILAPFIALYAVSLVKKKEYKKHIKFQKTLFWICVLGVVILEVQIRFSGGSGSLVAEGKYVETDFFKNTLIAHIIGAIVTYVIWGVTIFVSDTKWKKRRTLPGTFTITHRRLGYITIIGLFYTAITALMVCVMAFFL